MPQQLKGYNAKLADINESDTDVHTTSLDTLAPNVVAVIAYALRSTGTGNFTVFPNEGTTGMRIDSVTVSNRCYLIKVLNNRIKYEQSVANDDWDLYILGYIIEGEITQ